MGATTLFHSLHGAVVVCCVAELLLRCWWLREFLLVAIASQYLVFLNSVEEDIIAVVVISIHFGISLLLLLLLLLNFVLTSVFLN